MDISVVLAWLFEEQHTTEALAILQRVGIEGMLVPGHWWSELENGILMGERRGRRSTADTQAFLDLIHRLPIQTDDAWRPSISHAILDVARKHRLTAYDAAYLELAQRTGATLATFDAALRVGAAEAGVQLLPV